MNAKARQVAYLVQDLVSALAPNADDGEDEQQQESGGGMTPAQQELYEYCMLILGSRMGEPLSKDEFNVAELIKKKLSAGGDTTKAIRFAKLFNQLQNVSALSDNWRVLYLLYSLMGSGNEDDHSSFCLPLRSFAAASTTEPPPISSREAPLRTKSASDATSQRAAPERETLHRSSPQNLSYEVDPSVLVFDTLYCFQNIEGLHIKWDTERDSFAVPNEVGIQAPVRQLVSHMCEAGWLCRHIRQRLQTTQEAATSSGLVLQSFHTGVEDEINAWERAVAEAQVQVRSSNHNPEDITLRRIRAWMTGYLSHLKNLSLLVDVDTTKSIQQKAAKGGALISRLYAMHHHGDPSMRRLAKRLLRHAARPLFGMIQRWVTRGLLEDPFAEFFVAEDRAVPLPRLWYDRYAVRESMVPAFMDSALVNKIFLIGKSINFIRECCDERHFSVDELWRSLTNNDSNPQKFMTSLTKRSIPSSSSSFFVEDVDVAFGASSPSSSLRNTISSIGVAVSKQLLQLLFEKYKFREHCTAIKRYLLLGQGDFIHYLMKLMREALSKPATNLYRHNLSGILERAIQGSYAQYEHEDIRERLDVRLLPTISLSNNEKGKQEPSSSPSSTSVIEGWDVFSLDYHVSGPVDTIFTMEAMESYYQIFNFLWQLKRVYFGLTTSWQKDMMMTSFAFSRTKTKKRAKERQKGGRRGKWKEEEDDEEENENDDEEQETRRKKNALRHKCNLLRQRMLHFVSNVQFYAMGEVVDIEWEKLQQRMEEATELPELIDAHNAFLGSVSARLFQQQTSSSQTTPSSQLLPLLKKLFDIILRSLGIFESLSSTSSSPSSLLESSALRLKGITNEYEQTLLLFVTALQSAQKEQRIFEHLHPLCLRLSFNDYHHH
ncbi:Gamma-tubulin complex component 3 [Balamuthia mandrillaris]